jgi:hypothetical protein
LTKPAGEFVGALGCAQRGVRHSHLCEKLEHAHLALGGGERAVQTERVGDFPADRSQRIERDESTLRDEADVPPAEALQPAWGCIRDVGRIESQLRGGDGAAGEAKKRACGDAFAGPGFPYDRDALPRLDVERDA